MLKTTGLVVLTALLAAPTTAAQEAGPDFTDPVQVVEAIFEAARTQDPAILPDLCPPDDANDGDTESICNVKRDGELWDRFVEWFAKGEVTGAAAIARDRATVPFRFGPDGMREEEMRLQLIDGRWYLASF